MEIVIAERDQRIARLQNRRKKRATGLATQNAELESLNAEPEKRNTEALPRTFFHYTSPGQDQPARPKSPHHISAKERALMQEYEYVSESRKKYTWTAVVEMYNRKFGKKTTLSGLQRLQKRRGRIEAWLGVADCFANLYPGTEKEYALYTLAGMVLKSSPILQSKLYIMYSIWCMVRVGQKVHRTSLAQLPFWDKDTTPWALQLQVELTQCGQSRSDSAQWFPYLVSEMCFASGIRVEHDISKDLLPQHDDSNPELDTLTTYPLCQEVLAPSPQAEYLTIGENETKAMMYIIDRCTRLKVPSALPYGIIQHLSVSTLEEAHSIIATELDKLSLECGWSLHMLFLKPTSFHPSVQEQLARWTQSAEGPVFFRRTMTSFAEDRDPITLGLQIGTWLRLDLPELGDHGSSCRVEQTNTLILLDMFLNGDWIANPRQVVAIVASAFVRAARSLDAKAAVAEPWRLKMIANRLKPKSAPPSEHVNAYMMRRILFAKPHQEALAKVMHFMPLDEDLPAPIKTLVAPSVVVAPSVPAFEAGNFSSQRGTLVAPSGKLLYTSKTFLTPSEEEFGAGVDWTSTGEVFGEGIDWTSTGEVFGEGIDWVPSIEMSQAWNDSARIQEVFRAGNYRAPSVEIVEAGDDWARSKEVFRAQNDRAPSTEIVKAGDDWAWGREVSRAGNDWAPSMEVFGAVNNDWAPREAVFKAGQNGRAPTMEGFEAGSFDWVRTGKHSRQRRTGRWIEALVRPDKTLGGRNEIEYRNPPWLARLISVDPSSTLDRELWSGRNTANFRVEILGDPPE